MPSREEVRILMGDENIGRILVQFVDLNGSPRTQMVPAAQFDRVIDVGITVHLGSLPGLGQNGRGGSVTARIDLDSYTPVPWARDARHNGSSTGTARFASDLFFDGHPHPLCPRQNLKRILACLREDGYVFNAGIEPEHFLVTKKPNGSIVEWDPVGADRLRYPCYDFKATASATGYLRDMMDAMDRLGWEPYQCDHEDANGQFEINFAYSDALTTADRYTFFKMLTRQYARKYGAIATHMANPFEDRVGNGGHVHYHLANANTGENLFVDPNDLRGLGLSQLAYYFIGGIFAHAPALCTVMSPTVNCYKRLQVGPALIDPNSEFVWTPAFVSYGDNNRTQMIRTAGPGNLEERSMSSACNPYLALAAYVTAGMDGIRRKLDPGEPYLGNLYSLGFEEIRRRGIRLLPQTLEESLAELKQDRLVQESLGSIYEQFLAEKEAEWQDYHRQVTRWEIERYLTLF